MLALFAEIDNQIQQSARFLYKKVNSVDDFPAFTRKNAIHTSLDSIKFNNVNTLNNKQQILQKLKKLQSLEQLVSNNNNNRSNNNYERDMYLIDMKKLAEKYFNTTNH